MVDSKGPGNPPESADAEESDQGERWGKVRDRFLDIAELDGKGQLEELRLLDRSDPELASEVRRLLGHDKAPVLTFGQTGGRIPDHFGPYEAVRSIGEGGMGEVYLARRIDGEFEREVAIKRLHPGVHGEQVLQRFLRERQTLARLEHEYIARLIDGGTTESGEPYLVLEYVEGQRIGLYCRKHNLDVNERLGLFGKVLKAVQYAHDMGVIHRDLKPSNILVRADGSPRLLDFGIARDEGSDFEELSRLTSTGQRLFTPECASPEQVRGESVDPSTDVFSLGVLLYTLLCDVGPWEGSGSMHELERRILESDPIAPSRHHKGTARRALSGDLDTIVFACLAKSPGARLKSVAALADEIDRYLNGLPIRTRATGLVGKGIRHVRRKPWQSVALVGVLAAFAVGFEAKRSAELAESRQIELSESLQGRFVLARTMRLQDKLVQAREELLAILGSLEGLPDEPQLELDTLVELARVYYREVRSGDAEPVLERALKLRPTDPDVWESSQARLLLARTANYRMTRSLEEAAASVAEAFAYAMKHLPPGDVTRLQCMTEFAGQAEGALTFDERMGVLDLALAEVTAKGDPHDHNLGSIQHLRGSMFDSLRRFDEALACVDIALEVARWHSGDGHGGVALLHDERGRILLKLKRLDEAQGEFAAALEAFTTLGFVKKAADSLKGLGEVDWARDDFAAAFDKMDRAKDMLVTEFNPDHPEVRELSSLVGLVLFEQEFWGEAVDEFFAALEPVDGKVMLGWGYESEARFGLARALMRLDDAEGALEQAAIVIEIRLEHRDQSDGMLRAAQRFFDTVERTVQGAQSGD